MATVTSLMTAEEYADLPNIEGYQTELVKGVLITMVPPMPRHGEICSQINFLLRSYLVDHPIGRVLTNDSGVITERDPDTVRGADIAFYSFERVPKGPLAAGLLEAKPELVFEVRSPDQRWSELHIKVAEYLRTGVDVVCVLDDDTRSIHAFYADRGSHVYTGDDDFRVPHVLGDFHAKTCQFFE